MRFDLFVPTVSEMATPEILAALCAESEARGIGCIWVGEHVVLFDDYRSEYPYADNGRIPVDGRSGMLEPLNTLAFLAAQTSTVRLGTAVVLLPQRNPVYTAKEAANVDWLSGGRLDLGVGVGWLREEFTAVGVDFARRGARTDEYLAVLKTLWCDPVSFFEGEFYRLDPCIMAPKPVQHPHPPIHIGGESEAALRRAAAFGDGWHTFNRQPAALAAPLRRLDELLGEHGRNRAEVTVTVSPYFQELSPTTVEQYAEAGADAVSGLLYATSVDDLPGAFDALMPSMERAASI